MGLLQANPQMLKCKRHTLRVITVPPQLIRTRQNISNCYTHKTFFFTFFVHPSVVCPLTLLHSDIILLTCDFARNNITSFSGSPFPEDNVEDGGAGETRGTSVALSSQSAMCSLSAGRKRLHLGSEELISSGRGSVIAVSVW